MNALITMSGVDQLTLRSSDATSKAGAAGHAVIGDDEGGGLERLGQRLDRAVEDELDELGAVARLEVRVATAAASQ